jgi:hypothetical protein
MNTRSNHDDYNFNTTYYVQTLVKASNGAFIGPDTIPMGKEFKLATWTAPTDNGESFELWGVGCEYSNTYRLVSKHINIEFINPEGNDVMIDTIRLIRHNWNGYWKGY